MTTTTATATTITLSSLLSTSPPLLFHFDIHSFVSIITSFIDIFAATVIAISTFQVVVPIVKDIVKSSTLPSIGRFQLSEQKKENLITRKDQTGKVARKNFINGLVLALELESANAILKMGLFIILTTTTPSSSSIMTGALIASPIYVAATSTMISNFILFVGILSIRIAINQTLRRLNM